MGHLLFGLPEIRQFHLHSRLARKLMTREHRVTVLSPDPVTFEFYCHQGLASRDLRPGRVPADHQVPVCEFAALDCRLAGVREPSSWQLRRAAARLERRIGPLIQLLEDDRPDVLVLCEGRGGLHRMLHFLAVRYGVEVLHIGPGLLPLTMQIDADGIDGDSSLCRATGQDYRGCQSDDEFLRAATGAWLGRAYPPPLARVSISIPPVLGRLVACAHALARGDWRVALFGMGAWEGAYDHGWPPLEEPPELPDPPFAAVLLQRPDDPRLCLDDPSPVPPARLIEATRAAVRAAVPDARTLVVCADPQGRPPRPPRGGWPADVLFAPEPAAAVAAATALLVVTVNHPLGLGGVLSNTPVLHFGRTPYGLRGVTRRTTLDMLGVDVDEMLRVAHAPLRTRFLTRMLKEHHVWCPPALPDSNGIAGLVEHIEGRLPARSGKPLRYRPGPVWPLSVEARHRET